MEINKKTSYDLIVDGFIAEIRDNILTIILSEPKDENLKDPVEYELTDASDGLKLLGASDKPNDSIFELFYSRKGNDGRGFSPMYANIDGSCKNGENDFVFNKGKGWYLINDKGENYLMSSSNNYNPRQDICRWVVRQKDNRNIVWEKVSAIKFA
jgi:hypothetical protein